MNLISISQNPRILPPPGHGSKAPNPWFTRNTRPAFPRVTLDSGTKELDMTFSLGRPTDETEVMAILIAAGCVEAENYMDSIQMVKIKGNVENGQVTITCKEPGQSDKFVDKINALKLEEVRKCHSYTNKDIPVKMNFLHAMVDK